MATDIIDVWLADNRYCTTVFPPEMNAYDVVDAIVEAYTTGVYKVLGRAGEERGDGRFKQGFEIAIGVYNVVMEAAYPVTGRK